MQVIYFLGDEQFNNVTKIGRDSKWPGRFEKAQSHNPRQVLVHGLSPFSSKEELKIVEKQIGTSLFSFKRTNTHGKEWYNLSPEDAVKYLTAKGILKGQILQDPKPCLPNRPLPYDDWRSIDNVYKGKVYKRLLWVFLEDSPEKRIKVIHSPLFDTCYRYAFTFNPFPVYLVAAYQCGPSDSLREGNQLVQSTWEGMVKDPGFGPGLDAVNVGWLKAGASMEAVRDMARNSGLAPYDLSLPKSESFRPSDGYGAKQIPYGSQPPMRRVQA